MKIFSIDGPVYKFMSALTNVFLLSMCWLIGSIPIVTVGISTVALYDVTLRMVDNEEGYIIKQFIKAYKNNLKQGFLLGLINLVCVYVIYFYYQLLKNSPEGSIPMMIIAIVTGFLFLFSFAYAYPLTARYVNSVPRILNNSFKISMKYIGKTVLMLVVIGIEAGAFAWNLTMVFIGVLIAPACIAFTVSAFAKPIFKTIEKDSQEREESATGEKTERKKLVETTEDIDA